MSYRAAFNSRFQATPPALRFLLKLLGFGAVCSWTLSAMFGPLLGSWTPDSLLSLRASGIEGWHLWQWISYMFVLPGSLSFGTVLYLLFALYLIWIAGTALIQRVGVPSFLKLFVVCGLAGGVAGWLALLALPPTAALGGPMAAAYGLLVAWAMHVPGNRVLAFFLAPLQMRWLVVFLLGYSVLSNLQLGHAEIAAAYAGASIAAYFYGLLAWNLAGPFSATRRFDQAVAQLGVRLRQRKRKRSRNTSNKIYDFKSGHMVGDGRDSKAEARRQHVRDWQERQNDNRKDGL